MAGDLAAQILIHRAVADQAAGLGHAAPLADRGQPGLTRQGRQRCGMSGKAGEGGNDQRFHPRRAQRHEGRGETLRRAGVDRHQLHPHAPRRLLHRWHA